MRRRGYGSLLVYMCAYVCSTIFFLNIVYNYYSYQILYAASNNCKLSFHVLTMKEVYRWQAFKKLSGKNAALRKFLTPVDRERIVSKKICGNFWLC